MDGTAGGFPDNLLQGRLPRNIRMHLDEIDEVDNY